MVNTQTNQGEKLNTTPWKKNKEKSKFTRKREEKFFVFLLTYLKKKRELFLFFGKKV